MPVTLRARFKLWFTTGLVALALAGLALLQAPDALPALPAARSAAGARPGGAGPAARGLAQLATGLDVASATEPGVTPQPPDRGPASEEIADEEPVDDAALADEPLSDPAPAPPLALVATVSDPQGAPGVGVQVTARLALYPDERGPEETVTALSDGAGRAVLLLPAAWAEGRGVHVLATAIDGRRDSIVVERQRARADHAPAPDVGAPVGWVAALRLVPLLALEGEVCDEDGRPLPATVVARFSAHGDGSLLDSYRLETRCDAQGRFVLPGIPAGAGQSPPPAPGCAAVRLSVELEGWLPAFVDAQTGPGTRPVRVVLQPADRLEVEVRDEDGSPLPGVHVEPRRSAFYRRPPVGLDARLPVTDREGRLRLASVGLHTFLAVWADGHVPALFEVRLPLPRVELTLARGGRVSGRVSADRREDRGTRRDVVEVRLADSRPVRVQRTLDRPGVRRVDSHALVEPLGWARPDASGRFELGGLPPGCELELQYGDLRARARAGDGEVFLGAGARLGRLRLQGVDAQTGKPLPSCRAELDDGEGEVRDDEEDDPGQTWQPGRQLVTGQGPVRLLLHANGYVPASVQATLSLGEVQDLGQVRLARGARLVLRASPSPTPLRGLRVKWRAEALGLRVVEVIRPPRDPEQALTVEDGLPTGTPLQLTIEALPWDGGAPPRVVLESTLTLREDEARTLTLELR